VAQVVINNEPMNPRTIAAFAELARCLGAKEITVYGTEHQVEGKQLSDRELDAVVAEQVMGHEVRLNDQDMLFAYHRRWVYSGEKYIWWKREGYQPEMYLPHYSTMMVDAILVLNQMHTKGFTLGVNPDGYEGCAFCGSPPRSYVVWFSSNDRDISDSQVIEADSLPEAICRAALMIVNDPAHTAQPTP
jgi:hypothetical protein